MKVGERQLTLVVPMQAAHPDAACHWFRAHGSELPCGNMPALNKLLRRARPVHLPYRSLKQNLGDDFGIDCHEAIPYAALRWQADTGSVADKPLLCMDPVQLIADMDHVLLYDNSTIDLQHDEVNEVVASLNDFLRDDNLEVVAPTTTHWYLRGMAEGAGQFTPIEAVVGRNILPSMPHGESAQYWKRLLNEIQVMLHAHPVNISRREQGRPMLNGVWPWGHGKITVSGPAHVTSCYANDAVITGMAATQDVYTDHLPADFEEWRSRAPLGASLVVLADVRADNAGELCKRLTMLDWQWFMPITRALQDGHLQQLVLVSGIQRAWQIESGPFRQSWRYWLRPARSLQDLCEQDIQ